MVRCPITTVARLRERIAHFANDFRPDGGPERHASGLLVVLGERINVLVDKLLGPVYCTCHLKCLITL